MLDSPQMGQNLDILRSFSVHLSSVRPILGQLTHFGAKTNIPNPYPECGININKLDLDVPPRWDELLER